MSFWLPVLKIITIFAFFQVVGIRRSDMHFVYSLAKALAMVSSPAFNVSMFTWSFLLPSRFSSSLARLILPMLLLMVLLLGLCVLLRFGRCHKVRCKTLLFVLRSYPGLEFIRPDCLGVLSVYFGLGCVFYRPCSSSFMSLLLFVRCLGCIFWYLLSLSFLPISVYSMQSLAVFFTISLRFFISALDWVDNLELSRLVFCSAMLVAVCWIISVMFSFIVPISSSSFRAVNLLFSSSWNSFFLIKISLVSTFGGFFFLSSFVLSAFVSNLMLLINILWSLPMFMRIMILTSVIMFGLSVMM